MKLIPYSLIVLVYIYSTLSTLFIQNVIVPDLDLAGWGVIGVVLSGAVYTIRFLARLYVKTNERHIQHLEEELKEEREKAERRSE